VNVDVGSGVRVGVLVGVPIAAVNVDVGGGVRVGVWEAVTVGVAVAVPLAATISDSSFDSGLSMPEPS
jgi:hypothetical protein